MSNPRVFLSYSVEDKEKVDHIAHLLERNDIEVWGGFENIEMGSNLKNQIRYNIESSETVLIFLSKDFFNSEWSQFELQEFIRESEKRKINIFPVLLERVKIPPYLSEYLIFRLYNSESAVDKLIQKIKTITEISFDHFSPIEFENFVASFLKEYGFRNIEPSSSIQDKDFDFRAEYLGKNPFGTKRIEHWLIEVKFYKHERFSINTIKNIIDHKRELLPEDLKLLLITNGILTSVADEYLENFQKIENTQIEVIDGMLLKQLVSRRKRLLDKYSKI